MLGEVMFMYSSLEIENILFEELHVRFCGMMQCQPNYSFGPAFRQHYLIHVCLSGQGEFHIKDKIYTIKPGDAFLIVPDVTTFYQASQDNPWAYAWIGFDGTKAKQYLEKCNLTEDHPILHCNYIDEIREIIISMLAHFKLSYSNELYIQAQLFHFFYFLTKSAAIPYEEQQEVSDHSYVSKAIEYIRNNFQNLISVQEIADYLCINRSYLTTLFKQNLNLSPQEFIIRYRMHQAEDLLVNTKLSIKQIAYSCGYSSQLSFSKAFHKFMGCSPKDFRKQYFQKKEKVRDKDPHEI